jgi:hypothetical protein
MLGDQVTEGVIDGVADGSLEDGVNEVVIGV